MAKSVSAEEKYAEGTIEREYLELWKAVNPTLNSSSSMVMMCLRNITPYGLLMMKMKKDGELAWFDGPYEDWELKNFESPNDARRMLYDCWMDYSADVAIWGDVKARWAAQTFDCVCEGHLVLGGIDVPVCHKLDKKDEVDVAAPASDVGRTNTTTQMVSSHNWGTDRDSLVAVRGKINGNSFVKVNGVKGAVLKGPWDFVVTADFPVQKAEWYGGKFYIIYPYGLESFEYNHVRFEAHPWLHPKDFVEKIEYDGMMILDGTGREYRTKYIPTFEVMFENQIWECCMMENGISRIKVRPGKKPTSNPYTVVVEPTTKEWIDHFPERKIYSVVEVRRGPPVISFSVSRDDPEGIFLIDSGLRTKKGTSVPVPYVDSELVVTPDPTMSSLYKVKRGKDVLYVPSAPARSSDVPLRTYIGSKLIIYVVDRKCLAMYKESGKKVDFVGGTREGDEVPSATLIREVREETGVEISPKQLLFLGHSDEVGPHGFQEFFSRSTVFLTAVDSRDPLIANMELVPLADNLASDMTSHEARSKGVYQTWTVRIAHDFKARIGTIENLQQMLSKTVPKVITLTRFEWYDAWLERWNTPTVAESGEITVSLCKCDDNVGCRCNSYISKGAVRIDLSHKTRRERMSIVSEYLLKWGSQGPKKKKDVKRKRGKWN